MLPIFGVGLGGDVGVEGDGVVGDGVVGDGVVGDGVVQPLPLHPLEEFQRLQPAHLH